MSNKRSWLTVNEITMIAIASNGTASEGAGFSNFAEALPYVSVLSLFSSRRNPSSPAVTYGLDVNKESNALLPT